MTRAAILYLASFAAHGAMAIGIVSLKGARTHEDIAISMVESKKPEPPKPIDTPPPPPKEAPAKAKAPNPKTEAPPPPLADAPPSTTGGASDGVPDFGLALGGGGSLAVPAAAGTPAPSSSAADRVSKKVLAAPAETRANEECAEPPKKPKVTSITQPSYTSEARAAEIAGKVRVEVTVDATGKVASARVLEGLGHGLDDAALAAARAAQFEAGTKCGKPVTATFVIAIRFAL